MDQVKQDMYDLVTLALRRRSGFTPWNIKSNAAGEQIVWHDPTAKKRRLEPEGQQVTDPCGTGTLLGLGTLLTKL